MKFLYDYKAPHDYKAPPRSSEQPHSAHATNGSRIAALLLRLQTLRRSRRRW